MNTRIIAISVLVMCLTSRTNAQEFPISLLSMQGIWERAIVPELTNNTSVVVIYKGFKSLGIEYSWDLERYPNEKYSYVNDTTQGLTNYLKIWESYIGFQSLKDVEIDTFNIGQLKDSGTYFTEVEISDVDVSGNVNINYINTREIAELDESSLWFLGGKLSMYSRLYKVPDFVLKILYNQGKQNHRDYIKDYINIRVVEIVSNDCILYLEPNQSTDKNLHKGDIVAVLEEKKDWLNVEFDGKVGWIKRKDTK